MKKYLKKALAVSSVLAICMPILASCGSNGGSSSSSGSSSSTSTSTSTSTSASTSSTASGSDTKGINVTGLPLVETKETIKVITRTNDGEPSNGDLQFWKTLEEKTNVHIEWNETLQSAWMEKKNVLVASNDQPDIYYGNGAFTDDDVQSLGAGGKFIAIQEYISTFMPNLAKHFQNNPEWQAAVTAPDGNIYAVPSVSEVGGGAFSYGNPPFVNKGWIENVKLSFEYDPTKPITTEQFTELLTAFKTQDPNKNGKADEIPWSPPNVDGLYDWGASFGILGKNIFVKGDQVVWSVMQPEFKDFVSWLNSLWSAGLMDIETFTQNSSMYNAKIKNPDNLVGLTTAWRPGSLQIDANDDRFTLGSPVTVEGHDPAWRKEPDFTIIRGGSIVTSSAKNKELCLRWIDNLLDPENSLQLNSAQLLGEHLEKQADGTYKQLRPIDWNRDGERLLMPGNYARQYILTKETWNQQQTLPPVSIQKDPIDQAYAGYAPKNMSLFPNTIWMSVEDAKKINNILSEITPYIDTTFATWVTAGGIDSGWEDFQKTLTNMGANDAIEIYQKYYDAAK